MLLFRIYLQLYAILSCENVQGMLKWDHYWQVYLMLRVEGNNFPQCSCIFVRIGSTIDRLGDLVIGVLGYRSGSPGSIPGTTRKKSSGSGTGSTQPCEYS
jgi:hypothetical protein